MTPEQAKQLKTQTICRIVGRTRLDDRSTLSYIYRERLDGVETYSATDGRALTQIIRPIPQKTIKNSLLFERAFLTANGSPAKRQDRRFPDVKAVYPQGEAAVYELSASALVNEVAAYRRKRGLALYPQSYFLAEVGNRRVLLTSCYVYRMASNVVDLFKYGFRDTVKMHLYPGEGEITMFPNPILFLATGGDINYRFLVQPSAFESRNPDLKQCIKLN